jgi:hypothetical protein
MQNVFHSLKQSFFSLHQELLPTSILLNNQNLLHYPHKKGAKDERFATKH